LPRNAIAAVVLGFVTDSLPSNKKQIKQIAATTTVTKSYTFYVAT
jgi:hypothetical protein